MSAFMKEGAFDGEGLWHGALSKISPAMQKPVKDVIM